MILQPLLKFKREKMKFLSLFAIQIEQPNLSLQEINVYGNQQHIPCYANSLIQHRHSQHKSSFAVKFSM